MGWWWPALTAKDFRSNFKPGKDNCNFFVFRHI